MSREEDRCINKWLQYSEINSIKQACLQRIEHREGSDEICRSQWQVSRFSFHTDEFGGRTRALHFLCSPEVCVHVCAKHYGAYRRCEIPSHKKPALQVGKLTVHSLTQ